MTPAEIYRQIREKYPDAVVYLATHCGRFFVHCEPSAYCTACGAEVRGDIYDGAQPAAAAPPAVKIDLAAFGRELYRARMARGYSMSELAGLTQAPAATIAMLEESAGRDLVVEEAALRALARWLGKPLEEFAREEGS